MAPDLDSQLQDVDGPKWIISLKRIIEGVSPVQNLAISTIRALTLGIPSDTAIIYSLALLEVFAGLSLLLNIGVRYVLYVLYFQILGTFVPFSSTLTSPSPVPHSV